MFVMNGRINQWYVNQMLLSDMITYNKLSQLKEITDTKVGEGEHEDLAIYSTSSIQ